MSKLELRVPQDRQGRFSTELFSRYQRSEKALVTALMEKNVAILVAIGVNQEGFREVLGVMEGAKENQASWQNFLRHLKDRGLQGVRVFISDKCLGLVESLASFYPDAHWQRCAVHFYRNVWTSVPTTKVREVAAMLKAIQAQEDLAAARAKAALVVPKLREMKLAQAAETVARGIEETLCYFHFQAEHWRSLRNNNPLERLMREIGRRTRAVGAFRGGNSALILVAAACATSSAPNGASNATSTWTTSRISCSPRLRPPRIIEGQLA